MGKSPYDFTKSKSLLRPASLFVRPYIHTFVCPSQKINFTKLPNVTNECCYICFSDEKNTFGPPQGPRGTPGVKPKVGQTKKRY